MKRFICFGLFLTLCLAFMPKISIADDTGFASMHDLRKERGKLCMVGHYHYGSGESSKSKSRARRAAIISWSDFTDWEYGSDWARFSNAASRSISCSKSGGTYSCQASGRPCRRGRRR